MNNQSEKPNNCKECEVYGKNKCPFGIPKTVRNKCKRHIAYFVYIKDKKIDKHTLSEEEYAKTIYSENKLKFGKGICYVCGKKLVVGENATESDLKSNRCRFCERKRSIEFYKKRKEKMQSELIHVKREETSDKQTFRHSCIIEMKTKIDDTINSLKFTFESENVPEDKKQEIIDYLLDKADKL